ncbi:MAG: hypothetical protein OQJ97_10125 [Rhodospirillales bacterium]|nr:hypothetical protein [Rhodospirillales bacterium]
MYNFINPEFYEDHPDEAVISASDALSCISLLLSNSADIELGESGTSGLTTLLDGISNVLNDASGRVRAMRNASDEEIMERLRFGWRTEQSRLEAERAEEKRQNLRRLIKESTMLKDEDNPIRQILEETHGESDPKEQPEDNSSAAIAERVREKMAKDKEKIYPKLTAKEQAIASTFKIGFPVTEIAKAVNLKATSVENIIKQLKEKGHLEESNLDNAVNG